MTHPSIRSPLLQYIFFLGAVWAMLLLARAAFTFWVGAPLADEVLSEIVRGLYIGARFDGRLAALLTLPFGIVLCVPALRARLALHSRLVFWAALAVFFPLWTIYAVDAGFYAYLGLRLNAVLFELLEDTQDNLRMVWESYPVILITLAVTVAAVTSAWTLARIARTPLAAPSGPLLRRALCLPAGILLFAWAFWGQISSNLFPLRWSNAYFSPSQVITALALNPVQNLYDTYTASQDEGFDIDKVRKAYPLMASYLGVDRPDSATLNYDRLYSGRAQDENTAKRPPNIIIIIAESFSHHKSSFAPGPDDPTPEMKALAGESLYYPLFFANARTTARAVYTAITGIPDVTKASTGSRNPFVIDQRVIADQFHGYDKFYMMGGSTNWANIRGILSNNIQGLTILEESAWKAPNVDVWGISDFDLLMESHDFFSSRGDKPFLAVIQTASFHKPFTVPDDTPGFEKRALTKETEQSYGFVSEEEYNSMRYMDFALGEFFRRAKNSPYYANSIFFVFGDHGINDPSHNMNAAYNAANLGPWHVPLIIHAPGRVAPGTVRDAASQVDVFPTAAGLAGIEYTNHTLGRDLFDTRYHATRNAFISGKPGTPIRLVQDGWCYVDNRAGQYMLYRLEEDTATDHKETEPERFARMRELADGLENTAAYMLYNNKKLK